MNMAPDPTTIQARSWGGGWLAAALVLAGFVLGPGAISARAAFVPLVGEGKYRTASGSVVGSEPGAEVGMNLTSTPHLRRGYMIFDLSGIKSPIHTLTLDLHLEILETVAADETWDIHIGSTPFDPEILQSSMHPPGSPIREQIFESLGGSNYGTVHATLPGPSEQRFTINLSPEALADAEAARLGSGYLALGFNGDRYDLTYGRLTGRLSVGTPEPGGILLVSLGGLALLGRHCWRRRSGLSAESRA